MIFLVMPIFLFCLVAEYLITNHKNTKGYMTPDEKNIWTLFSSTYKVEENKLPLFYDPMQTWWVMYFLLFCIDAEHMITNHKSTKGSYIPYIMSGEKNKSTLFSSTFNIEEKGPSFLRSVVSLVSYGFFCFA